MSQQTIEKATNLRDVEDVISRAIKKVGAKKEKELCHYIPMSSGGYLHHFTLKKMKLKQPGELASLLEKFIIDNDRPGMVAPKQRAPRGSRKGRERLTFSPLQLDRMLSIARLAGDKEMVSVLSPKRSLASAKRELISSIRKNQLNQELWEAYVSVMSSQQINQ